MTERFKHLKPEDLVISEWRGQRQGGWIVKPVSGVQIVHRPTGAMVQCDSDRSQHRNKVIAMDMLDTKVGTILAAREAIAVASAAVTIRADNHGLPVVTATPAMPKVKPPATDVKLKAPVVFTQEDLNMLAAVAHYMAMRDESPKCSADLLHLRERIKQAGEF